MTWHASYRDETRQFSDEGLREGLASGSIPIDALVWTDGMNEWRPASTLFGLSNAGPGPPPPKVSNLGQPTFSLLFAAVIMLSAASVYALVEQDVVIDFLALRIVLGAAIVLHLLALTVIAVLSMLITWLLWRHPSRRGAAGGAGALFLLSACASLLQAINVGSFALVAPDIYRLRSAVEALGDADIRKTADGTAAIIGTIGPHLMRDFRDLEKLSGPIGVIEITSEGGLVDQALLLARQVESQRISVIVKHQCLSACILIAVASPESYADADAIFGFHRTAPVADVGTEIARYGINLAGRNSRDFLRLHGVPESVLEEAAKHGEDSVHVVSAWKMVDYGAIKGILSEGRVVKVGTKR